MKIQVSKALTWGPDHHHEPAQLCLMPTSHDDCVLLAKLIENYEVVGFGRDPETMQPTHVELLLTPKMAEALS